MENSHSPWLYVTAPDTVTSLGCISLPKVIGVWQDVWYNGEGSNAQVKNSQLTIRKLLGFNDGCIFYQRNQ